MKRKINAATNLQSINGYEVVSTTDISAQMEDGLLSSKLILHDF